MIHLIKQLHGLFDAKMLIEMISLSALHHSVERPENSFRRELSQYSLRKMAAYNSARCIMVRCRHVAIRHALMRSSRGVCVRGPILCVCGRANTDMELDSMWIASHSSRLITTWWLHSQTGNYHAEIALNHFPIYFQCIDIYRNAD